MSAAKELRSNVFDTALIFEGGGMRASYTCAVAVGLLNAEIHMDWVAGISAGSSNTANYIARDPRRARLSFTDFAGDPHFGGIKSLIHGTGWFNGEYIYEHTGSCDEALPFNWPVFSQNPAQAHIGSLRADTGEQIWFTKADMPTMGDLMVRVRASSTMPGLMRTVHLGELDYVDGALGPNGGIALDRAQKSGFDRFLVVLTRPRSYRKPAPTRSQEILYKTLFAKYPAVIDALIHRHIGYNQTREELFDLAADGEAYLFIPAEMPVSNGERNVKVLQKTYQLGAAQMRQELPAIREFLGK